MQEQELANERRRRRQARRVRGYRIRVWYPGRYTSSQTPTLWAAEPALPAEWEATKNDPQVVKAVLFRSGKPFEQFTRPSRQLTPGQSGR